MGFYYCITLPMTRSEPDMSVNTVLPTGKRKWNNVLTANGGERNTRPANGDGSEKYHSILME